MKMSDLSNIFQRNGVIQQNPLGKNLFHRPAGKALNRLSQNLLTAKEEGKEMRKRFDRLELSMESTAGMRNSTLEEMPEGVLKIYLWQAKVGANLSQRNEDHLMEYRDQLSAFDRTIQEYQDMLDGKTALPEQVKRENISRLLDAARAAREKFLQEGAEKLNGLSDNGITRDGYLGKVYDLCAEWTENSPGYDQWKIDASADDIYGEIDRALSTVHGITRTFQTGAVHFQAELARRGCLRPCEEGPITLEPETAASCGTPQAGALFESIYKEMWDIFKQNAGAIES